MSRKDAAEYLLERIEEAGLTPQEVAEKIGKTPMAGRLWTLGEKDGEEGRRYTVPSAQNLRLIAKKVKGFDMDKYLAMVHSGDELENKPHLKITTQPKDKKMEERVTDGGMAPLLIQGYVIEIKKVTLEDIVPGHTYFVVVGENKLVRIIRQSKSDKNRFVLVPSNTEKYDEWEVEKSKISGIYKIISFTGEL